MFRLAARDRFRAKSPSLCTPPALARKPRHSCSPRRRASPQGFPGAACSQQLFMPSAVRLPTPIRFRAATSGTRSTTANPYPSGPRSTTRRCKRPVTDAKGCTATAGITFHIPTPAADRILLLAQRDGGGSSFFSTLSVEVARRTGTHKLGSLTANVPAGKRQVVRIRLSNSTLSLLGKRGHLRIYLACTLQGGAVTSFDVPVTLTPSSRKHW